jgi:extradiol dioxygenase family protein
VHDLDAARLEAQQADFIMRFRGEVGEQVTLFLRDPSGNAVADPARIFAT